MVKMRWRPWGLAGPQPKQWLARSSMVGVSIEAGVWRVASGVGMASGLHVSTVRGGMNSDSVLRDVIGGADFEDAGAEFFYFFVAEAVDGF